MTPLEERIKVLEDRLNRFEKTDRYTIQKLVQLLDGRNIQTGVGTGTKIGTAATQKISFYGAAPVAQQTGVGATAGALQTALINLGLITS